MKSDLVPSFNPYPSGFDDLDIVAVAVYFVLVMAVGLYSMCRSNRGTVSGYFLAGRHMWWLPVGASIFASNIGSEHFIGLAGSGAAAGIAVGAFEFNALLILQLLGWIFLPVFIASGVSTLPEYMKKRFGGNRIRIYLACLSLVLYIFTKISVDMYSGALFIQQALQWSLYPSILLLLAATAILTVSGGLAAVIYTDTLQFFIMIIGALAVMGKSFSIVGGWEGLHSKFMQAIPDLRPENTTCGIPPKNSFVMLRGPLDPEMPWPAFLLGQTPASIWYWCADQMMVQRALAAKSLSHAQGATLFAGFIKILPLFVNVMPGMISRILFKNEIGCALEEECMKYCGNPTSCTNNAYPRLVLGIMPIGMRGIMVAVMLAALMSDLTSIFNSASTLFTIDVYTRFKKQFSNKELVLVGRVFTLCMVAISIAWIPIVQEMQGGQLYIYIQVIAAYLSPPIAAVYCLAVGWKRTNEKGAFIGLMLSTMVGVIRMILEFVYRAPKCWEEDTRPAILANVHYMYFAVILFWLTIIISVIVSLLTEPPEPHKLVRTTYSTRFDTTSREDDAENLEGRHGIPLSEASPITDKQDEEEPEREKPWYKNAWNWCCGFSNSTQQEAAEESHLQDLQTLHQSKSEKRILNIFLVLILAAGVFLYVFFSVAPYDDNKEPYKNSTVVLTDGTEV